MNLTNATRHYLENLDGPLSIELVGWQAGKGTFLAIDAPSYASYTGTTYTAATELALPGDHGGFVLAIDSNYDSRQGTTRPDESPGFQGHMRILGSLIWGDLYAMLSSQSAIIEDIWPLAIEHPNQVYVGPTVPLQIKAWRIQNGIRGMLMRTMVEYGKAKVEGRPWPPSPPSTPAPRPSERPTQPPNTQSSQEIPPPQNNTPVDPVEYNLRTWMRFQFARWLRSQGLHREAILEEESMRAPDGQLPDMDNIYRRMMLEGALENDGNSTQRPRENEENEDEESPTQ
ncbi:hypothetical protein BJX63DRAFT_438245 [Aspergillus granulosus]|uniref:Uncharacterized protein n=1 Tax=Aspergillus granulosus TaxID=176169 RepID=A0ABR4GSL4_9EURO